MYVLQSKLGETVAEAIRQVVVFGIDAARSNGIQVDVPAVGSGIEFSFDVIIDGGENAVSKITTETSPDTVVVEVNPNQETVTVKEAAITRTTETRDSQPSQDTTLEHSNVGTSVQAENSTQRTGESGGDHTVTDKERTFAT